MKFAFLIDPPETLNLKKDTSLALMLGAQRRGHRVFIFHKNEVNILNEEVFITFTEVVLDENFKTPFLRKKKLAMPAADLDVIFIRMDPPFDETYLHLTWFLEIASKNTLIINDPKGIRDVNEKIWIHNFPRLIPESLITPCPLEYKSFLQKHEKVILKPTDGFGGKGIFISSIDDHNANVIFETLMERGSYVIIQEYIPQSQAGDKRILLLEGEPIGAVLRVNQGPDHRNNFAAGGIPKAIEINKRDKEIISELKPFIIKKKLYFIGIDILGDFLTEVNVTSPTGLREVNQIYNLALEEKIINLAEEKVHCL